MNTVTRARCLACELESDDQREDPRSCTVTDTLQSLMKYQTITSTGTRSYQLDLLCLQTFLLATWVYNDSSLKFDPTVIAVDRHWSRLPSVDSSCRGKRQPKTGDVTLRGLAKPHDENLVW